MRCWLGLLLVVTSGIGFAPMDGWRTTQVCDTTLTIRWQRLVDDRGETCQRCGLTEEEVETAVRSLRSSLQPLGIRLVLERSALDVQTCARDILQSNRIWIGERSLEVWLGAEVGRSLCGSCCGELGDAVECRTVTVDGATYEAIPAALIVKAGLLAAADMLTVPSDAPCSPAPSKSDDRPPQSTNRVL